MKMKKQVLGIMLGFVIVLGLMIGTSSLAFAQDGTDETPFLRELFIPDAWKDLAGDVYLEVGELKYFKSAASSSTHIIPDTVKRAGEALFTSGEVSSDKYDVRVIYHCEPDYTLANDEFFYVTFTNGEYYSEQGGDALHYRLGKFSLYDDANKPHRLDIKYKYYYTSYADVPVERVFINGVPETGILISGNDAALSATVTPAEALNKTVTWSSNNTDVITVDNDGVITAKAPGSATITVTATNGTEDTSDDKSASCEIKVPATVTFETNGGTAIDPQYIILGPTGGLATEPDPAPTKEGYTLDGWYTNETFEKEWRFDVAPVEGDMTLYAKWKATPAKAPTISNITGVTELEYGSANHRISVTASAEPGHTLSYQWYSNSKKSKTGGTAITSGGTEASYVIPADKNVGTYYYYCVVTATRTDNNETQTDTSNFATVTVTRAHFESDLTMEDYTYGDTPSTPKISSNPGNGAVTYYYNTTTEFKGSKDWNNITGTTLDPGTYYMVAWIRVTDNYYEKYTVFKSFSVGQRSLTPSLTGAVSKVYDGSTSVSDAASNTLAISLDDVAASDGISAAIGSAEYGSADKGTNISVTASGITLTGTKAGNYTLSASTVSANVGEITQRPITIKAKDKTLALNAPIPSTADDVEIISENSLASGENIYSVAITGDTSAATTSGKLTITEGSVVITSGTADVTDNYSIALETGTLTVTAGAPVPDGELTATAITYGQTLADSTISGSMKYDGAAVTGTFTWDMPDTKPTVSDSNTTEYGWTFTPDSDNYASAAGTLKLTINPKPAALVWENTELTYNGEAQKPAAAVSNLEAGDNCEVTVTGEQTNVGDNYTAVAVSLSNSNYQLTENTTTVFKINKAKAEPATVTANNRTYDGTEKPLVKVEHSMPDDSKMRYALGTDDTNAPTDGWSTSIPAKTNAGTYYVWYKVVGDDNHNDTGADFVPVTIAQASIADAVVTLNNTSLDYTGSEQSVSVTGVKLGEKMLTAGTDYEVSGETTGTNKGTYTVTVTGKGNYKDTAKAQWTIDQMIPTITTVPTATAITYGQTLKDSTLSGGVAKNGNAEVAGTFTWKDSTIAPAVSDSETTEYDVVFTPTDTENYGTASCKVKLTVNKASPTVTAPAAKALTASGEPQALVTAGTAEGGEMQYALGTDVATVPTDGWSTTVPSGTDAGTYYVWYKVVGDGNHTNTDPVCVPVIISAAPTSDGDTTYTQGDTGSGVHGVDTGSVKKQMEELAETDTTPCGDNQTKDVTVTMDVSAVTAESIGSEELSAIFSVIGDQSGVQADYLEITVEKSVTVYDVDGSGNKTNPQTDTTQMHELGKVVDIPVKYDMTGKQNPTVVRYHDGHTAVFTRLDAAPAAADMRDGTFYIEGSGKDAVIHIYSSMFSTYAILTNAEAPASPAVITVAPAAKDLTWTGAVQELVTAGTAEGGTMQYAPGANATTAPADGWSAAIPAGTNAGTYYVWYKAVGDATHTESAAGCVAVEIKKAKAVITVAPVAVPGLIWTGAPQALVTAGTAEGGTVIYALGADATTAPADGWSETIPAATEAGTYYVWYKAVGDANHIDSARDCVVAAIAQKEREKPSGDLNALLKTKGLKGLKLTWTPMANVDGYDVFMARSTKKFSDEPYATLAPEASQLEFGKLKKKTAYKVNIRAFVLKDGVKEYVGQNETLYSITGGANKRFTNAAKIRAKSLSLAVGDKKQVNVTLKGQKKGKTILNRGGAVRYLSSDPTIATVSDKGFVRGIGEGSCTIFLCTHNGLRATIIVTVTGGPEELKFDKKSYKMSVGKTLKLKKELTLLPEGTKSELKWKSSDKKIATVDENGKVTAKKAGTVKITVTTSNGITATVKIKIK